MPKIDITRPELIWPGKYDENGNRVENRGVALPFQIIETIKEGRATREPGRMGDLFSFSKPKEDSEWRNKLIWGDNLLVMASLMEEYAGKIDLIYIDPPFATGADFRAKFKVGDDGIRSSKMGEKPDFEKLHTAIEEKVYRDTWGKGLDTYFSMLYDRLCYAKELLSQKGSLYLHLDPTVSHYAKLMLDEIFGRENFKNEVIWCYKERERILDFYNPKHDVIFFYSKSDSGGRTFNWAEACEEYSEVTVNKFKYHDEKGHYQIRGKNAQGSPIRAADGLRPEHEEKYPGLTYRDYIEDRPGVAPRDWWTIPIINKAADERLDYATQKPEALLERIIRVSSNPDDIVMDFFGGSGTTAAVAEKLGRRWISCDLGRFAIHTARKRLLEIPDCKPFEVLNLGKYERKYWQGVTFGETPKEPNQVAIAAYVAFILELYKAQPLAGTHIHGKKGKVLVHVGAVDAPVTINQVNEALAECARLGQKELHVLGWEWEMGMNDPIIKHAQAEHGITLRLLNIPREVMEKRAVECGDIRFFDLAFLEAEIKPDGKDKHNIQVELTNFVIPDTELIPDEVREKITKWSDYIDYWAVDWDFKNDTFMNHWQTYRTRKNRKLALVSESYEYKAAGRYRILIKIVDIFGNDTSRLLEWEVK